MAIAPLLLNEDDPAVARKWWEKGHAAGIRKGVKAGLDTAADRAQDCGATWVSKYIRTLDPEAIAAKAERGMEP